MEYFDISLEEVAKFGAFETINIWEDLAPNGWQDSLFSEPVFSQLEQSLIREFCQVWEDTAKATEFDIFEIETLRKIPEWVHFVAKANSNLTSFYERGRFSQEIEHF